MHNVYRLMTGGNLTAFFAQYCFGTVWRRYHLMRLIRYNLGDTLALWLVGWTLGRGVWAWAMAGSLCFVLGHDTLL